MKYPWYLLLIYLFIAVASAETVSSVQVDIDGNPTKTLSYDEQPRLGDLVIDALNINKLPMIKVDWLSSALFDVTKPFMNKDRVLSSIKFHMLNTPSSEQIALSQLLYQLNSMKFAKREFIPLDPDFVRISNKDNPKMKGKWLLSIRHLPSNVMVIGAVKKVMQVAWQSRVGALDYIHSNNLLNSNISEVIVIQPDGVVQQHAIAYWNVSFKEVAPAAVIYVPFSSPESPLDEAVVELMRNRIY